MLKKIDSADEYFLQEMGINHLLRFLKPFWKRFHKVKHKWEDKQIYKFESNIEDKVYFKKGGMLQLYIIGFL